MTHSNGTTTQEVGQRRPLKILVVGAGIGGLVAAIALRKQGHDVEVCEEETEDYAKCQVHFLMHC